MINDLKKKKKGERTISIANSASQGISKASASTSSIFPFRVGQTGRSLSATAFFSYKGPFIRLIFLNNKITWEAATQNEATLRICTAQQPHKMRNGCPKVFYSPHKVRYNYLVFFSKSFGHFSNNKKKKKSYFGFTRSAIVSGYLVIIRNSQKLFCFQLRRRKGRKKDGRKFAVRYIKSLRIQ